MWFASAGCSPEKVSNSTLGASGKSHAKRIGRIPMVNISNAFHINVEAGQGSQPGAALAAVLEGFFPVKFGSFNDGEAGLTGKIIVEVASRQNGGDQLGSVSSLSVPHNDKTSDTEELVDITATFADDIDVPFPYRGRTVRTKVARGVRTLVLRAGEKTIAHTDEGPVWTVCPKRGAKHFRSGFPLPAIPASGGLLDFLNGERFLEMLPLLHWLREMCESDKYEGPPLRACFIIDDPNLHWPRYGFVDYQKIAARAEKENYHVSIATIPLDAWFTHKATAELFKQNSNRLSLGIHGNNHIKMELARNYSESERISLLTQSIQRMERLERNTGLQVSRVMVPPHGACSEEMLGELPRNGFEAASISHGSLRVHNKTRTWTRNLGYLPCELIQGCPVLPRWSLTVDKNTFLLAAFLKQPLILRGHHQDLKGGIELLDRHAQFINSLGTVTWSNLTDLSRMNYQWRTDGRTCRLRPMSPKVVFQPPKGLTGLIIESTSNSAWGNWRVSGANGSKIEAGSGAEVPLSDEFQGTIDVEAVCATSCGKQNQKRHSAPSAVIRRLLTEGRDRFSFWQ